MGLGRKIFTRERLTVADTQGYLMDQTVMYFASASAANTAVPAPSKGMHRYLADIDRTQKYDGSTWRDVAEGWTRAGVVAVQQTVAPGGTYAWSGVVGMPAPFVGCVMEAELSLRAQFEAAAQQTLQIAVGLTNATEVQSNHDIVERTFNGSGSGPAYEVRRTILLSVTAPTFTIGYNAQVGSGASNVVIGNPRCFVKGPYRVV